MSTTIKEELSAPGDTPSGEYLRNIAILDQQNKSRAIRGEADGSVFTIPGSSSRDSFARFRISIPLGIFDSKQLYVKDQFLMIESLSGGATSDYSANDSSVILTLPTTDGAIAIRQSKINITYQPGRGALIFLTGNIGAPKENVRQRWGIFDENDGLFWEQTDTGLGVVRRTSTSGSPVDNIVPQASWNLDTLDGNGPSGVVVDPAKMNLYVIDFAWLGVGSARMGIEVDGTIIYCHLFQTANSLSTIFIRTPSLPIRWEIENTGTSASETTMQQTCCASFSEGGLDPIGFPVVASNETTLRSLGAGATVPVVSARLRSGFLKGFLIPIELSASVTTADDLYYQIVIGGTIPDGAWVNAGLGSEVNVTGTSISGGIVVQGGYLAENAGSIVNITKGRIGATGDVFTGTADTVTLTLASISTSATAGGTLVLHEIL